jgi:hypothetical protein
MVKILMINSIATAFLQHIEVDVHRSRNGRLSAPNNRLINDFKVDSLLNILHSATYYGLVDPWAAISGPRNFRK